MDTIKDTVLQELHEIIMSGEIKHNVDRISQLRSQIQDKLTPNEDELLSNNIKSAMQNEGLHAWSDAKCWGAIFGATGVGKSRIGVMAACAHTPDFWKQVLIVVPTMRLRDVGWPNEIAKWGCEDKFNIIKRCCYASFDSFEGQEFDLVILDEGHNITLSNSQFFNKNKVKSLLILTATKPTDPTKVAIYKNLGVHPQYEITATEAEKLGIVAPYDVVVINIGLDDQSKYIPAGTKAKPFMVTEAGHYSYLTKRYEFLHSTNNAMIRMRFIHSLRSKTEAAKLILKHVIPTNFRTLIFCASIDQAIQVCDRRYYSKPVSKKTDKPERKAKVQLAMENYEGKAALDDFCEYIINRMSCVDALNEGENISDIECIFIIQLDSVEGNFIQRVGRMIRYKPGFRGIVIILTVTGTVDAFWTSKATKSLAPGKVKFVSLSDIREGKVKITFNQS